MHAELAGADVHVADVVPQQAVDVVGAQVNGAGQEVAPLHLASFQWPVGRQPLERAQAVLKGGLGSPDLPPVAAEHLSRQVLRVAVSARTGGKLERSTTNIFWTSDQRRKALAKRLRLPQDGGLCSWSCTAPHATGDGRRG